MSELRQATKWYICVLVLVTLVLLVSTLATTHVPPYQRLMLAVVFAGLGMIAFAFPLQLTPEIKLDLHTSVLFATTILFEPGIAMLVASTGPLFARFVQPEPWDPPQTIFNTAQFMLQVGIGGLVLVWSGWNASAPTFALLDVAVWLVAVAVAMYIVEFCATTLVISLDQRRSPLQVLRSIIRFNVELVSQFALGLLGAIIADVSIWALPLLIPPLLVVYRSNQQQVQLRKQAEALEHQAFHDALTGLPNRTLFLDRVQHALDRTRRGQEMVAMLFLDLDRFKYINDSLGHDAGDQLLKAAAQRLLECVRPGDTVARLGGDEFTLLLEIEQVHQATMVADRIKRIFQAPFAVGRQAVFVSASIGIAFSDTPNDTPSDLMRHADAAMYKAKDGGRACYQIFDVHNDVRVMSRLQLETELHHALERHEFVVYYQPLVDLHTGSLTGFEALVRWVHPQHGLMPPAQFIPLAEDTGLILPLDQLVLRAACQQARAWLAQLPANAPLSISVNLSARQFQHTALLDDVARALAESGLEPHRLQLEITESVVMQHASAALATLQQLKRLGVQLAIDDFGTGYSSLSYLKHFPVDTLKIDRMFVESLERDDADAAIAQTIITLAHTLDLHTVAEGVETPAQQQVLHALGCEFGQGFFFAKPLSSADATVVLFEGFAHDALRTKSA